MSRTPWVVSPPGDVTLTGDQQRMLTTFLGALTPESDSGVMIVPPDLGWRLPGDRPMSAEEYSQAKGMVVELATLFGID